MALKPVTDPNILAALGSPALPAQPAAPVAPTPVTDPALLAQLNAPEKPPLAPGMTEMNSQIPVPADPSAAQAPPEPSIWDKFLSATGLDQIGTDDPIIDMLGHGAATIAKGAPEVAMNTIGNTGVQAIAGLTAPLVGTTPDDQANFVRDFTEQNSMLPQGDSAKQLTEGLGEAFAPVGKAKRALGDTTLAATGSPLAATTADMLPDLGAALLGARPGAGALEGAAEAVGPKVVKPVSPTVESLRAADIRLRPSDVRAMNPDKAVKVPGEFREKFASGPKLKEDLTLHNQVKMTDIAKKDIGAKALDDASLDAAEKPAADTYDMVENVLRAHPVSPEFEKTFREGLDSIKLELPRGKPYTITGVLGAIRRRSAKRLQADNPEMEAKGYADRNMADAIEEGLGNELQDAGEPQLFKEYQDARQAFAKINDVRSATRAGQIDANVLYKLGKRGAKLSGGLKLIADAAENAPNVTGHSLKTAARAGEEVPNSKEGIFTRGTKAAIRKIPGMDVGAEGFQSKFGEVDPARASYYGRETDVTPPRGPEQGSLDLRETMALEPPPGAVGTPARTPREFGPQVDALGNAFEFDMAPGEVGVPPPAPISLQDLLGLGEPLNLKQSPGRVGKPKRNQ